MSIIGTYTQETAEEKLHFEDPYNRSISACQDAFCLQSRIPNNLSDSLGDHLSAELLYHPLAEIETGIRQVQLIREKLQRDVSLLFFPICLDSDKTEKINTELWDITVARLSLETVLAQRGNVSSRSTMNSSPEVPQIATQIDFHAAAILRRNSKRQGSEEEKEASRAVRANREDLARILFESIISSQILREVAPKPREMIASVREHAVRALRIALEDRSALPLSEASKSGIQSYTEKLWNAVVRQIGDCFRNFPNAGAAHDALTRRLKE